MDEDDYDEYRHQAMLDRRYKNALLRHPDCRDPDHPGCEKCEPELFTESD